jgi:hypothetical protein
MLFIVCKVLSLTGNESFCDFDGIDSGMYRG